MQPGFRPKCSGAKRQPWTIDVSMSSAASTSYGECEQWWGSREHWLAFPVVWVFLEHTLLASLSAQRWGWKWKDGCCPWRPHGGGKEPGVWIFFCHYNQSVVLGLYGYNLHFPNMWRKLSAEELMLLNCGVGEDSWESLGLQGDPTSPFWRLALGFLWKEWC